MVRRARRVWPPLDDLLRRARPAARKRRRAARRATRAGNCPAWACASSGRSTWPAAWPPARSSRPVPPERYPPGPPSKVRWGLWLERRRAHRAGVRGRRPGGGTHPDARPVGRRRPGIPRPGPRPGPAHHHRVPGHRRRPDRADPDRRGHLRLRGHGTPRRPPPRPFARAGPRRAGRGGHHPRSDGRTASLPAAGRGVAGRHHRAWVSARSSPTTWAWGRRSRSSRSTCAGRQVPRWWYARRRCSPTGNARSPGSRPAVPVRRRPRRCPRPERPPGRRYRPDQLRNAPARRGGIPRDRLRPGRGRRGADHQEPARHAGRGPASPERGAARRGHRHPGREQPHGSVVHPRLDQPGPVRDREVHSGRPRAGKA